MDAKKIDFVHRRINKLKLQQVFILISYAAMPIIDLRILIKNYLIKPVIKSNSMVYLPSTENIMFGINTQCKNFYNAKICNKNRRFKSE